MVISAGTKKKSDPGNPSKRKSTQVAQTGVDATPRALRDDVQEFKRSVILAAATELFFKKGYQNTTVDEIAAAMSVSKQVVYWNFSSKLALLEAIVERSSTMVMDCVKYIQPGRTPVANLAEFCFRLAAPYLTHRKEVAVHLFERRNLSEDIRAKVEDRRKVLIVALSGILEDGVRRGDFSPMDCELVAYDIINMITMSFDWRWHEQGHRHSPQSLSRHFAEQALRLVGYGGPFPFDDNLRIEQHDFRISGSPDAVAGGTTSA